MKVFSKKTLNKSTKKNTRKNKQKLPVDKNRKSSIHLRFGGDNENLCGICLEPADNDIANDPPFTTNCDHTIDSRLDIRHHTFHTSCINRWCSSRPTNVCLCPICRGVITNYSGPRPEVTDTNYKYLVKFYKIPTNIASHRADITATRTPHVIATHRADLTQDDRRNIIQRRNWTSLMSIKDNTLTDIRKKLKSMIKTREDNIDLRNKGLNPSYILNDVHFDFIKNNSNGYIYGADGVTEEEDREFHKLMQKFMGTNFHNLNAKNVFFPRLGYAVSISAVREIDDSSDSSDSD